MRIFTLRGRRWVARLGLAGTSAAIGLVATGAVLSPASADAPVKVGWWNLASGGGQAAPAPDTNAGGIRVAVATNQWLSFGAVQYSLPRDGSATLELKITQISGNSNAPVFNQILACPTKDNNWKAGDDQDAAGAPAFDCDVRHFVGHLSADQTTMTFLVDGSADVSDGVLSLAIVPQHSTEIPEAGTDPGTGTDLTPPFAIDFDKPGANEFTAEANGSSSDSGSGGTDSSSTTPPPTTTGSSSSGGGTAAPAAPAAGSINVPPATGTDPAAGQSPVVAGQQPTSTGAGSGVAPAAAVAPAKSDNSKHDLLLVLLVLILFGILYTQNGAQRAPRIAASAPRPADGDATALPVPYPPGFGVPGRGLGRFNKPRVGNARPLI
jgi:hypothetical protein